MNQNYKVFVFAFLLLSTTIIPSSSLAYAAGDLVVDANNSPVVLTPGGNNYDSIDILSGGELIIPSGVTVTIIQLGTVLEDGLQISNGGKLTIENGGKLFVHGFTLNNGDIFIDGSYNHQKLLLWNLAAQTEPPVPGGKIYERCGVLTLGSESRFLGEVAQSIECVGNETQIVDWILDDVVDLHPDFTVGKKDVLWLYGTSTIFGEIDNFGEIYNLSIMNFNNGELENNASGKLYHVCASFTDDDKGISDFRGTGEWPSEGDKDHEDTICSKPIANNDGNEATPFVTTTEDDVSVVSSSVLDNDNDADFVDGSETYDKDIGPFLPGLIATSEFVLMSLNGTFTYDPKGEYEDLSNGEIVFDTFSYTVDDRTGGTDTGVVTVAINGVNDDPTAVNDPEVGNISVNENSSITIPVLNNDSDPDRLDILSITSTTQGTIGTTTHDGSAVTYTPNFNLSDLDSFTYTISDGNGGVSTATVNINVINQNDPPVISLNGPTFISLEVGDVYAEQGATCSDPDDGQIDDQVVIGGDMVNTSYPDVYEVTYDCQDSDGSSAEQVTRTVAVVTNEPPVITILGANPASVIVGETYVDAGAEAEDIEDGNLTNNITETDNVDTSLVGNYQVTYSVTDSDGNTGEEIRTVAVNEIPKGSLRDQTIEQIMKLEDLIDEATDKKTKDEINKALKDLNKSVEQKKWEDNGNYLIEKEGKKVFDEQQKGTKHIVHILDKDKESDEFLSKVDSIALELIDIDEELSGNEFTIAEESPDSKQKCLDDAEKEYEKSEKEEVKGKYDKAIDHLGHLWEKSVKCQ